MIKRLLRSAHQIYLVSVRGWVTGCGSPLGSLQRNRLRGFIIFLGLCDWIVLHPRWMGLPPTNNSFSHLVAAGDQTDSIATISKLPIHSIRTLKAFKERSNLRNATNEWKSLENFNAKVVFFFIFCRTEKQKAAQQNDGGSVKLPTASTTTPTSKKIFKKSFIFEKKIVPFFCNYNYLLPTNSFQ